MLWSDSSPCLDNSCLHSTDLHGSVHLIDYYYSLSLHHSTETGEPSRFTVVLICSEFLIHLPGYRKLVKLHRILALITFSKYRCTKLHPVSRKSMLLTNNLSKTCCKINITNIAMLSLKKMEYHQLKNLTVVF